MSKNSGTKKNFDLIQLLSFVAIVLAAAMMVISYFGSLPILNTISQICAYIALGLQGYYYTRGRSVAIRVIYWVSIILLIIFCVLPIL